MYFKQFRFIRLVRLMAVCPEVQIYAAIFVLPIFSMCVCACVLLTPASQSNGAAPSGPNTWPRLFDLSGDECAPETDFVHVFELQTEAPSGQPGGQAENLHLLPLPRQKEVGEQKRRWSTEQKEVARRTKRKKEIATAK